MRSDNYQDTSVIDRVAAAPTIVDDDARYAEYQALEEKIIHDDYSWVPLFALDHEFAISDDVRELYTALGRLWRFLYFRRCHEIKGRNKADNGFRSRDRTVPAPG